MQDDKPTDGGADADAVSDIGPDLDYSLKRLVKGLASPRAGARQGFSIALSELMRVSFSSSFFFNIFPPSLGFGW